MTATSWLLVAEALAVLLIAALGVHGAMGVARRVRALEDAREALGERIEERARVLASRERLEEAQRVAEGAVGFGTESVREVHMAIADIPFGVLEQLPVTRDPARVVRQVHDVTAQGVYDAIGLVNRLSGRGLRSRIHRPDRVARSRAEEPSSIEERQVEELEERKPPELT